MTETKTYKNTKPKLGSKRRENCELKAKTIWFKMVISCIFDSTFKIYFPQVGMRERGGLFCKTSRTLSAGTIAKVGIFDRTHFSTICRKCCSEIYGRSKITRSRWLVLPLLILSTREIESLSEDRSIVPIPSWSKTANVSGCDMF